MNVYKVTPIYDFNDSRHIAACTVEAALTKAKAAFKKEGLGTKIFEVTFVCTLEK